MKTRLSMLIVASLFCIAQTQTASAENYVGIILDGYQTNCEIKNKNEDKFDCSENKYLFVGDEITKKPAISSLMIKWMPYAKGIELSKLSLKVVFVPPRNKKGILQNVSEFLGFVKTEHKVSMAATRSGLGEYGMVQPSDNVTLIPGQIISFISKGDRASHILFKDSKGVEIFRRETNGKYIVQLTPEEIGLKTPETYYWQFSGARINKPLKIRLLEKEVSRQISADLEKIGHEESSEPEKNIKQAAYLQFMSDAYPEEFDLYWLSYQILNSIKEDASLKEDDRILKERLEKNYIRHLSSSM